MSDTTVVDRADRLRKLAAAQTNQLEAQPVPNDIAEANAELVHAAVERQEKLAALQAINRDEEDEIEEAKTGGLPEGVLMQMPDGRYLYGCYVLLADENTSQTLMIKDENNRVKLLSFTKNVLFIFNKHDAEQVALNMREHTAYASIMMKASEREARSLVDLQATAQRQVAQSGPLTSPVTRAAEFMLQGVMQAAKIGIAGNSVR
jgi:hypothetical protein